MSLSMKLRALALGWAVLGAAAMPASAQRADPRRIIDFHLNAERQNVSFDGAIVEGRRFRLRFPNGSGTYTLAMVQLDASRKLYAVTVFRGGGEGDTTTYQALETVRATVHVPAPLTSLSNMRVVVVIDGTRVPEASTSRVPIFNFTAYTRRVTGAFDECCILCSGIWACGCAVRAACAECCVQPCCGKMPAPPPGGGMAAYFPDRAIQDAGRRRCKEVPVNERIYPALYSGERIASR